MKIYNVKITRIHKERIKFLWRCVTWAREKCLLSVFTSVCIKRAITVHCMSFCQDKQTGHIRWVSVKSGSTVSFRFSTNMRVNLTTRLRTHKSTGPYVACIALMHQLG